MKLGEILKGTPREQTAAATIKALNTKSSLSTTDRAALTDAITVRRGLSRRRFLAGTGGALATGALIAAGIGLSQDGEAHETLESWRNLSATDRLNRLFSYSIPEVAGFDALQETVLATAQHFTETVRSNLTAEELAARTHPVSTTTEFVKIGMDHKSEVGSNNPSDEKLKQQLVREFIAFTLYQSKDVYLSMQAIQELVNRSLLSSPELKALNTNRNVFLEMVNYVLSHEYGHVSQTGRTEETETIPVDFTDGQPSATINKIASLKPILGYEDGNEIAVRPDEVLIDLQAQEVIRRNGNDIIHYLESLTGIGPGIVRSLNERSGVSLADLNSYIRGEKSIIELVSKWGKLKTTPTTLTPSRIGTVLYFYIGGLSSKLFTPTETTANINDLLK